MQQPKSSLPFTSVACMSSCFFYVVKVDIELRMKNTALGIGYCDDLARYISAEIQEWCPSAIDSWTGVLHVFTSFLMVEFWHSRFVDWVLHFFFSCCTTCVLVCCFRSGWRRKLLGGSRWPRSHFKPIQRCLFGVNSLPFFIAAQAPLKIRLYAEVRTVYLFWLLKGNPYAVLGVWGFVV
ncbi:unnamed protein product [Ectocarpus sp. 8 AP-2014]